MCYEVGTRTGGGWGLAWDSLGSVTMLGKYVRVTVSVMVRALRLKWDGN